MMIYSCKKGETASKTGRMKERDPNRQMKMDERKAMNVEINDGGGSGGGCV